MFGFIRMRNLLSMILLSFLLASVMDSSLFAQGPGRGFRGGRGNGGGPPPGRGFGQGQGRGAGQGAGMQHDERHDADHEVFQFLLSKHDQIRRTVKNLENGVETLTESDDPEVAGQIKEHVEWMQYRVENVNPIRMRDPLFAELFKHADKIQMKHEDTEKGVKVIETSEDPYVATLIQEHAKVVSKFVERGHAEAMKNHAVPAGKNQVGQKSIEPGYPRIAGHGAVVQLADAAHQPRPGTKLIIDVTKGSKPDELNSAIEKVAKYLNIYAGAGAEPVSADFAVIFHGDATLAVLNPDAYREEFDGAENPNLELLRQLHEAGVELYVCGQTLISKGSNPDDVAVFVETAVSALTVVVNLQADGYAFVPLGK